FTSKRWCDCGACEQARFMAVAIAFGLVSGPQIAGSPSSRPEMPLQQGNHQQQQETDSRLVFLISLVRLEGKNYRARPVRSGRSEPREKQRHGGGIGLECVAVLRQ